MCKLGVSSSTEERQACCAAVKNGRPGASNGQRRGPEELWELGANSSTEERQACCAAAWARPTSGACVTGLGLQQLSDASCTWGRETRPTSTDASCTWVLGGKGQSAWVAGYGQPAMCKQQGKLGSPKEMRCKKYSSAGFGPSCQGRQKCRPHHRNKAHRRHAEHQQDKNDEMACVTHMRNQHHRQPNKSSDQGEAETQQPHESHQCQRHGEKRQRQEQKHPSSSRCTWVAKGACHRHSAAESQLHAAYLAST